MTGYDRWRDPGEPSWMIEPTTEWRPQFPGQRYPGDIGLHQLPLRPGRGRATATGRAEVVPLVPDRTYQDRRGWTDHDHGPAEGDSLEWHGGRGGYDHRRSVEEPYGRPAGRPGWDREGHPAQPWPTGEPRRADWRRSPHEWAVEHGSDRRHHDPTRHELGSWAAGWAEDAGPVTPGFRTPSADPGWLPEPEEHRPAVGLWHGGAERPGVGRDWDDTWSDSRRAADRQPPGTPGPHWPEPRGAGSPYPAPTAGGDRPANLERQWHRDRDDAPVGHDPAWTPPGDDPVRTAPLPPWPIDAIAVDQTIVPGEAGAAPDLDGPVLGPVVGEPVVPGVDVPPVAGLRLEFLPTPVSTENPDPDETTDDPAPGHDGDRPAPVEVDTDLNPDDEEPDAVADPGPVTADLPDSADPARAPEPMPQPVDEPMPQPVDEPVAQTVDEPVAAPQDKPVSGPPAGPAPKPVATHATSPATHAGFPVEVVERGPGPAVPADGADVWFRPKQPVPGASRPAAVQIDPEQYLNGQRWRLHPETLRELVDEPDELHEVRRRLTGKLDSTIDDRSRARLLSLRAVTSRLLGELDDALTDARLALTYVESTGGLRLTAVVQARLARVLQWRGEFTEADKLLAEADSPELPDRLRATLHEHLGRSCVEQGRYIEACEHFERALELGGATDHALIARTEIALDAVRAGVNRRGFGPYPRTREELRQVRRHPTPTLVDQRWGYADAGGELVVPAEYAEVQPFRDGVAWVRRPDVEGWELIDDTGTTLIEASYLAVRSFADGLAWVSRDGVGDWLAIDTTDRVAVPAGFDDVRPFRCGVAAVRLDGGWGAVDRTGRMVVPPRYDGFTTPLADGRYVDGFTDEGLAVVELGDRRGVLDRNGRVVVAPGHAAVVVHPVAFLIRDGVGRWGALDRRGEPLIEPLHGSRAGIMGEIDRLPTDADPVL